jgi:hypothetical protein
MFFQSFAPQGLKRPAAAVKCIHFGKIRMPAIQVTKIDFARRHTRILSHINFSMH